jgi:hypothetical protein
MATTIPAVPLRALHFLPAPFKIFAALVIASVTSLPLTITPGTRADKRPPTPPSEHIVNKTPNSPALQIITCFSDHQSPTPFAKDVTALLTTDSVTFPAVNHLMRSQ